MACWQAGLSMFAWYAEARNMLIWRLLDVAQYRVDLQHVVMSNNIHNEYHSRTDTINPSIQDPLDPQGHFKNGKSTCGSVAGGQSDHASPGIPRHACISTRSHEHVFEMFKGQNQIDAQAQL